MEVQHRMTAHHVPPASCPRCFRSGLDAATNAGPERCAPKPGDVTVCLYCRALLVFTDTMQLRPLKDDEFSLLPPTTQAALRAAQRTQ